MNTVQRILEFAWTSLIDQIVHNLEGTGDIIHTLEEFKTFVDDQIGEVAHDIMAAKGLDITYVLEEVTELCPEQIDMKAEITSNMKQFDVLITYLRNISYEISTEFEADLFSAFEAYTETPCAQVFLQRMFEMGYDLSRSEKDDFSEALMRTSDDYFRITC